MVNVIILCIQDNYFIKGIYSMIKRYLSILLLVLSSFNISANQYEWFSPIKENGYLSYNELIGLINQRESNKEAYFFGFGYLSSMIRAISMTKIAYRIEFQNELYCRPPFELIKVDDELELLKSFYSGLTNTQKEIYEDLNVAAVYIQALKLKYPCK
ncbi:hypothetical protein [Gilliamella sp. wkB112]|uniref:hypothetical protein n=1 Tax=Gilliamella sp. wkB112 TaxID=3120257 RepID=UPI0011467412|nr:hypothetical protein [Gilliamella apicola]